MAVGTAALVGVTAGTILLEFVRRRGDWHWFDPALAVRVHAVAILVGGLTVLLVVLVARVVNKGSG